MAPSSRSSRPPTSPNRHNAFTSRICSIDLPGCPATPGCRPGLTGNGRRDGDVEAVAAEEELDVAGDVFAAGGRHREEGDLGLLALELVDGADADAGGQPVLEAADLGVERGEHEDVGGLEGVLLPIVVDVGGAWPSSSSIAAAMRSASSGADCERPLCSTGSQRRPVPPSSPGARTRWRSRPGAEPRRPSYISSETKAQTSGCKRKVRSRNTPWARIHGLRVAQKVLQNGKRGASRVRALGHLGQLLGIAEEDDVGCCGGERQRVGERDLAGLVDE